LPDRVSARAAGGAVHSIESRHRIESRHKKKRAAMPAT
jgi:hypothetical protein